MQTTTVNESKSKRGEERVENIKKHEEAAEASEKYSYPRKKKIIIKNVFLFSTFKLAVILLEICFPLSCIIYFFSTFLRTCMRVLFIIQRRKKLYSLINVQLICMMATESISLYSLIFWPRV